MKLSKNHKNIRSSLLIIALSISPCYGTESLEKAIMELIVNGHSEGEQFLAFKDENDVVVSKKLLKSINVNDELLATMPEAQIHLNQFPELKFKLDLAKSVLQLTIPEIWFAGQTVAPDVIEPATNRKMITPAPVSAYLNYQIQNSFSDIKGLETVNLPLEVGINAEQWFLFSNFTMTYNNGSQSSQKLALQRQTTYLSWDDTENMRTLVVGDISPPAQSLMGGATLGGFSWGTKFSVNRQFRAYPNLDLETIVASTSHAELIANGRTVKEWDVSPGRVLFSDLGHYAGSDATLLLTDAYGEQRRLSVPTVTSNQLLKPDLHEYNYTIGFIKNQTSQGNNFSYRHPLFSGYHRYGLTNDLTLGLAVETDAYKTLLSSSINTALGDHHKLNLAGATQLGKKQLHYAGSASYQFNWQNLFGFAAFNFSGRNYDNSFSANRLSNISSTPLAQHYQTTVGLGYNQPELGSLNANFSENVTENQKTQRLVTLSYQKQIFPGLNLTVSLRNNLSVSGDYGALLGFHYYPSDFEQRDFFNALNYQLTKNNNKPLQQELNLQRYNTRGEGFGYNATLKNEGDKDNAFGELRTQYNHSKGVLTTNYSRSKNGSNTGGFSISGSLSLVDGEIYAARPVSDSFALIKTGRPNVPVELYNTINGYTDASGELLVPELTSYIDNKVSIPASALSINETMDNNEQYVSNKQRGSGSVVNFNIQKFTAIEGNLTLQSANTKAEPLEAVPIEITAADKKFTGSLGREGYFYMENIPTGEYTLTVLLYKGNCSVKITVAETTKLVHNLGNLICTVDAAVNEAAKNKEVSAPNANGEEKTAQ